MDVPRRRGRPPGSKNKPKSGFDVDLTKPQYEFYTPELLTTSATFVVHLDCQSSFGDARSWSEDANWPSDWPLPQNGNNIRSPSGKGGQVIGITWDLHRHLIHIRLT